jgi:hypothetical protein
MHEEAGLEKAVPGPRCYKYGAPDWAMPRRRLDRHGLDEIMIQTPTKEVIRTLRGKGAPARS